MRIQASSIHYNKFKNHDIKIRLKNKLSNIKESHVRSNVSHIISVEKNFIYSKNFLYSAIVVGDGLEFHYLLYSAKQLV